MTPHPLADFHPIVSAADPLNLVGIVTPHDRVRARQALQAGSAALSKPTAQNR